ncbi:MAG TPA: family 1 glycosylhydrolase [Steroidobacteraceae bacterium]|nr:family 1 glycosylhydrolase [Steroidobacteraceae bacterium]
MIEPDDSLPSPARREVLRGSAAALAAIGLASAGLGASGTGRAAAATRKRFPEGFIWGTATAGHQVEGNDVNSDMWFLEQLQPTLFAEPVGDANNSLELWPVDLDLVHSFNLNAYRFSLEWSRIEPEPGQFSLAMLDHYLRMIEGCRARGLQPIVTFNHFATPRWFAARGGWTNSESPALFELFCERAARHLAKAISHATTLNEPNLLQLLGWVDLPPAMKDVQRAMLDKAARTLGVPKFSASNTANAEDLDAIQTNLLEGHRRGRRAIKAARPDLPVGVSLALVDDQALGAHSRRDEKRAQVYGPWLEAAKGDDFVGVQNYERARYDEKGAVPPPHGAPLDGMGREIYPASLANVVRYVHEQTARPILITEHGLVTDDDAQRAAFIPAALGLLADTMAAGVPVLGYVHWTLMDNFEWIFGYKPHFGLCSVDRQTFKRQPKPSAAVLAAIARSNAVG